MLLSIVTINYNNIRGFQKTIESVIEQTFSDYEWIIIDGGSDDGSKDLIEKNADRFSYWCSEPDEGIYNAMNKGLDVAHGDYVLFLNSGDSLFNQDVLSEVFEKVYNADVLYGDMIQVNPNSNRRVCYPDNLSLFFFLYDSLCHQATFYKRCLFENNRFNESYRIVSDWAMNLHLILQGKSYKHIAKPIVYYDNNGLSALIDSKELVKERMDAYHKHIPIHLQRDIDNYNRNYYFTRKRKSLRFSYDVFVSLLKKMDYWLSILESKKSHPVIRKR